MRWRLKLFTELILFHFHSVFWLKLSILEWYCAYGVKRFPPAHKTFSCLVQGEKSCSLSSSFGIFLSSGIFFDLRSLNEKQSELVDKIWKYVSKISINLQCYMIFVDNMSFYSILSRWCLNVCTRCKFWCTFETLSAALWVGRITGGCMIPSSKRPNRIIEGSPLDYKISSGFLILCLRTGTLN